MKTNHDDQEDPVAWVRRVNGRWIVHGGLGETAAAYMRHLEETDERRLRLACRHAHALVHSLEPTEDPKPWFYGGLFSVATEPEARTFLKGHAFLEAVVPSMQSNAPTANPGPMSDATTQKLLLLRAALSRLPQNPD